MNSDYLLQASASGISRWRLFWRHLLPNLRPILLAQFWISVPVFILSEANLGLAGSGCVGAAAILGRDAARTRELLGRAAESLDARARRVAGGGGELSAALASNRGECAMLSARRDRYFCCAALLAASAANELRFCLRSDPKTFNPLLVEDDSSAAVRYLTGGVLIRLNRYTQELEGELATKWKVSENGRRIDFELRRGVRFSDGTPFTCEDVAYTMHQLMDPALHSPVGDAFRSAPGEVETKCAAPSTATVRFPGPVAALAAQFDEVAILSARSSGKESAVLGPFELGEYKPGAYVLLRRNPNYWKHDANGHPLPYLDSIRLEIQQNRELELLRFRRGELDLINKLDPDMYDRLSSEMPHAVVDAGPSLDWETVFFNQVAECAFARVQAALVPVRRFPARDFRSHPPRRYCPHRLSRARARGCRSGFGRQTISG